MSAVRPTRRRLLTRGAGIGVATWVAPAVLTTDRLAAAAGSCATGVSVCEFSTGLEGWTIDNTFGPGVNGLWNHTTARDSGALHYGRGIGGNYATGSNRNSGAVTSASFDLPSTGPLTVTFTVWRQVENWWNNNYDVLRFSILGTASSGTLWSAGSDGGTGGVFQTINVSIPAAYLGDSVQFRFDFDTVDGLYNNFEGVYIGRITIPACPTPTGLIGLSVGKAAANDDPEFPEPHVAEPRAFLGG